MKHFDKIFRVFAVVLFAHSMFAAGAEFADNQISDGVVNLILAALWLSFLTVEWIVRGHEIKMLRRLERITDDFFQTLLKFVDDHGKANVTVTKQKPATQGKGKIKGAAPVKKPAAKKASKK